MRKRTIIIGIGVVLAAGMTLFAVLDPVARERRDSASRRALAHALWSERKGAVWTEGARAEGFVIDLKNCDSLGLRIFLAKYGLRELLDEYGVEWMRCDEGGAKFTAPWKM